MGERVFNGRFELAQELGRGAQAVVYRAQDAVLHREVALKVIEWNADDRDRRRRRLLLEVRSAARLDHPAIVKIFEVGGDGSSTAFVAMELVKGRSLRSLLEQPMAPAAALALVAKLARAIAHAHEREVVHRDLKPENILIDERGEPRIVDFGCAKDMTDSDVSRIGTLVGTPRYLSPEQARGDPESIGPPADVWALGVLLHELVTGQPPFQSASLVELLRAIQEQEPAGDAKDPAVARALAVARRALAKTPAARPTARAFAEDCERAGQGSRRVGAAGLAAATIALALVGTALVYSVATASAPVKPTASPTPSSALRAPLAIAPPASASGAAVASVTTGWSGEPLPPGLRRGAAKPLSTWALPENAGSLSLVYVPEGDFLIGSTDESPSFEPGTRDLHEIPHPARTVRLERGFWIGQTDVTWAQFDAFCAATGKAPRARPKGAEDDHPAVNVSWNDARAFCSWSGAALPTELEWEKAARGDDGRSYPWGTAWDPLKCNHGSESSLVPDATDGFRLTSPVTSFPEGASPYGALDMAGNVWQWCDGEVRTPSGSARVARGGSFLNSSRQCRSFVGILHNPEFRNTTIGFRVVLRSPG